MRCRWRSWGVEDTNLTDNLFLFIHVQKTVWLRAQGWEFYMDASFLEVQYHLVWWGSCIVLSYYFCFADLCPNTYFANGMQIYNEEINDLLSTFKGAAWPDETKSNVRSYIYIRMGVSVCLMTFTQCDFVLDFQLWHVCIFCQMQRVGYDVKKNHKGESNQKYFRVGTVQQLVVQWYSRVFHSKLLLQLYCCTQTM